jgi:hypothetical protein
VLLVVNIIYTKSGYHAVRFLNSPLTFLASGLIVILNYIEIFFARNTFIARKTYLNSIVKRLYVFYLTSITMVVSKPDLVLLL